MIQIKKKKTCKLDTEIPGSPSPTFMAYWNFFPISSRKLRTDNKFDNIFLIYNFETEIEILKVIEPVLCVAEMMIREILTQSGERSR